MEKPLFGLRQAKFVVLPKTARPIMEERKVVAGKLSMLLQLHRVKLRDASSLLTALEWLQTSSVGFSDAYLAAVASEEQLTVTSFDADFDKLHVARYEPTA